MANRNTLFITAEYMKARTNIDPNVDERYIGTAIHEAQLLNLIELIGSGLYDEIETQVDASTLTALNTTLLQNYIAPCLKYWTLVNLMPQMVYKMTNKGVVIKNSDGSSPISDDVLTKVMEEYTNKAQLFSKRLKDYLIENTSSFPLYLNPGSAVDTIHPETEVFDSGIFTGNKRNINNVPFGYKMDNPATYGCDFE